MAPPPHWASRAPQPLLLLALALLAAAGAALAADGGASYLGKYIGKLKTLHHGVSGEVYAVDARTLHIRNFNYDGEGPAAYFWAGDSKSPGGNGFKIHDEKGTPNVLSRYRNKHITLTLPENKTLRDIRWFSVWCDEFSVNFGDVRIPKTFEYPRPQKIDALSGIHGVSSDNIVVVDAQTLLIPTFSYDGEAPDAKFWVGRGSKPSPQGTRVPDENGKEVPLRRYDRKTIVLTLPGDLTVYDIGHFGVWCEAFTVDFGHVRIPRSLNVPPSLKMLGVSPQSKLNCEVLWDENAFEVRWAVAGDSVVIQLVGRIDDGEYMSFGLSGDDERSRMVGGDVAVVWVNHSTLAGDAQDYFLDSKSQCAGTRGSCPDQRLREGTNSIRLLNAAMVNGYSIVTYQRPLHAKDELDRPIRTNGSQPVIWALGPLNARNEVSYHRVANRHDVFIDFARSPKWNCPIPEADGGVGVSDSTTAPAPASTPASATATTRGRRPSTDAEERVTTSSRRPSSSSSSSSTATSPSSPNSLSSRATPARPAATPAPAPLPAAGAWDIPAIQCYEPEDGVFYAQMGPTGGKRGYSAITGHVGWGISWYINGLLIPEINVVRGRTYTFVVEGGNDPEVPARYHPFYITDDPVGGYEYKTPEEKALVRVFAGVRVNRRGEAYPTGTGRLCNWTPDQSQPPADEFASFGAYQRTLTLECDPGEPGVVQWTPDDNTPDTVYYQCYTHRYLGWRINVHDSCDGAVAAASEPVAERLPAPAAVVDAEAADADADALSAGDDDGDLQSRPSIRVATRVRPDGGAVYGDKANDGLLRAPYATFSSFANEGPFVTASPVTNQVGKTNHADLYLPPGALHQDSHPYSSSHGFIPLTDADATDGLDSLFTVTPSATDEPSYTIKPSPVDLMTPGSAPPAPHQQQQAHASMQPSSLPPPGPTPAAPSAATPEPTRATPPTRPPAPTLATTPRTLLNKTKDIKLVSSTAQPYLVDTDVDVLKATLAEQAAAAAALPSAPTYVYKRPLSHRPHGLASHGYILPNGRPGAFPASHMMMHRPQAYNLNPYRRPLPHRYVPLHRPAASMLRPTYISTPLPPYMMSSKKPYYRVTMLPVGGHRPMVSPSPYHRPMTTITARPVLAPQQQFSSSFKNVHYSLPPQRIKYDKLQAIGSTLNLPTSKPDGKNATKETKLTTPIVSPAPLLSTSTEPATLNLPIAVNTGFKPESIVVEGGFKPIVNKDIAQDRSSLDTDTELVDQEDLDTRTLESLEKELLEEPADGPAAEDRKDNPFEGQQPETFEPMFIPSPPDRASDKNVGVPEDLLPPVPAVLKTGLPRPVLKRPGFPGAKIPVRLPIRPQSPAFRFQEPTEQGPGELALAAERMDTYFLPPSDFEGVSRDRPRSTPKVDAAIPPGAVVAYDGKSVLDAGLSSSNPSASDVSRPGGAADRLRATPQFGPYQGEVPPPVPSVVHPDNAPQLRDRNKQPAQSLPAQFGQRTQPQVTRLSVADKDHAAAASEIKELLAAYDTKSKNGGAKVYAKKTSPSHFEKSTIYEDTTTTMWDATTPLENTEPVTAYKKMDVTSTEKNHFKRIKRDASPHHEPGHEGTDDDDDTTQHDHGMHDHSMHDHSQHDHSQHDHSQHDHSQHDHSQHDHSMHEHSMHEQNTNEERMKKTEKATGNSNNANLSVPTALILCSTLLIHLAKQFI